MSKFLDKINEPKDLKKLEIKEKEELAEEIRKELINIVSKNGGHLASNLGVVELTIALHSVFNTPEDKIIWDVGHQSYVHKMLTGRKDKMNTLRKLDGIAGFPKTNESKYDTFNTGHSSTSISVGTGMARARDILKENYKVISVIGDGSLTGGMALEALNDAGASKTNLIVILNDNEMSISKNVGGIPMFLSKLRTRKLYTKANNRIKRYTLKVPVVGEKIVDFVQRTKKTIKQIFIPNMYFEDIGFTYLGPVDGHNIEKLEGILKIAKDVQGPVLVHIITKKGKGYKFAEENPDKFHGISAFNPETGEKLAVSKKDYSKVFGDKLIELAKKDKKIVAVTAAMKDGTGLKDFAKTFPDRFFDVGIAEQHAVGLIAGMAKAGLKPVLPLYSSFLQRGYDQLVHDIALQNLPVTICIDRAGIVGNDGETHHGIFDMSFASAIPNLTIMAPKDFKELEEMLEFSVDYNGPVLIRYPRGGEGKNIFKTHTKIELGKAEIIDLSNNKGENKEDEIKKENNNKKITIVAIGKMVDRAVDVANILKEKNIDTQIINARFLKPIDKELILSSIEKIKNVVTIEDGLLNGGLYTAVIDIINNSNIENIKVTPFGYNDCFVPHGSTEELEKRYGTDSENIAKNICLMLDK